MPMNKQEDPTTTPPNGELFARLYVECGPLAHESESLHLSLDILIKG